LKHDGRSDITRDEEIYMSTTLQFPARSRFALWPYVIAILIALAIGAAAGSLVTRAVADRGHPVAVATGWDAQKLAAMQGRVLAASVGAGVRSWDRQKVAAMAGREKAEAIRLHGNP
jgi:hypothetical protein